MANVTVDEILGQMVAVLNEANEGPPEGYAYFSDRGADAGLNALLRGVDLADASKIVGKTSIAAQVYHLVFSAKAFAQWIRGDQSSVDWKESMKEPDLDADSWSSLRVELQVAQNELRDVVQDHAGDNVMAAGGAVGAVAHTAYHLAMIRQKLAVLRSGS